MIPTINCNALLQSMEWCAVCRGERSFIRYAYSRQGLQLYKRVKQFADNIDLLAGTTCQAARTGSHSLMSMNGKTFHDCDLTLEKARGHVSSELFRCIWSAFDWEPSQHTTYEKYRSAGVTRDMMLPGHLIWIILRYHIVVTWETCFMHI